MSTTAWYLKKSDGSVYGPVPLLELKAWAMDGRVAPDDYLSADRAAWYPAPHLDALGMEFTAHFDGGETYGPVHLRALGELIMEGDLRADVPVSQGGVDETRPAGLVVLERLLRETDPAAGLAPELIADLNELKSAQTKWLDEKEKLERREQELQEALEKASDISKEDELRKHVDDLTRQLEAKTGDAEKIRSEQAEKETQSLNALQSNVAELEAALAAKDEECQALVQERKNLAADVKELEEKLAVLSEKTAQLENQSDKTDLEPELSKAREELVAQRERADSLQAELEAASKQIEALGQQQADASDQDATIATLKSDLDTQQQRADALQTKWDAAQEEIATLRRSTDTDTIVGERTQELQTALDEERKRNQQKEARLQSRLNELEGELKEQVASLVRTKQARPIESERPALNEASAVVRSALCRARESSIHSSAEQHSPRPVAQRTAMIRKMAAQPPRPKRAPRRSGGRRQP